MLAASVPELSATLLDDIGRGDLAAHLDRLTSQRIFLEPVLGRADHVRTTVVGGAFLRRALPPPPATTLDRRSARCSPPVIRRTPSCSVPASAIRSGRVRCSWRSTTRIG